MARRRLVRGHATLQHSMLAAQVALGRVYRRTGRCSAASSPVFAAPTSTHARRVASAQADDRLQCAPIYAQLLGGSISTQCVLVPVPYRSARVTVWVLNK